jgi:hypothetical protein
MYQNETTNKFSREIALENVVLYLSTIPDKSHYFEIRTEQNIYYCGCKRTRSRVKFNSEKEIFFRFFFLPLFKKYDISYSSQHARNAYTQIRQALLAYNNDGNEIKSVFTIVTSRSETRDISEVYKINPVEVLGSGQFGTVYGGKHSYSKTRTIMCYYSWTSHDFFLILKVQKDQGGKSKTPGTPKKVGVRVEYRWSTAGVRVE